MFVFDFHSSLRHLLLYVFSFPNVLSIIFLILYPASCNPSCASGVCIDVNLCNCYIGYHGDACNEEPCDINPCQNGGSCRIVAGVYKCTCPPKVSGEFCDNLGKHYIYIICVYI